MKKIILVLIFSILFSCKKESNSFPDNNSIVTTINEKVAISAIGDSLIYKQSL